MLHFINIAGLALAFFSAFALGSGLNLHSDANQNKIYLGCVLAVGLSLCVL